MPNMSYCRFENTVNDMQDCLNAIEDREVNDLSDYEVKACLLYTSPSPRDKRQSRMPSSA